MGINMFGNMRTDLAAEMHELLGGGELEGVKSAQESYENIHISRIQVLNEAGAKHLGKPVGLYVTVQAPPFGGNIDASFEEIELIAKEVAAMLPQSPQLVLVAGLGNRSITPDALGPDTAGQILATRHISKEIAQAAGLGELRAVAAVAPGVLGQTGVETGEIIASIVKSIKPSAVIVVDALAAKSIERLGCTIQISDVGIVPGSGVSNARKALNRETLGIPVIAVGVPTVVDAATLAVDLMQTEDKATIDKVTPRGAAMMVTPREVDIMIERAAKVLSLALNKALQPEMALEDIQMLVG
ncbi:MAG: GPR endopeptidase [Acetanaerobacterium sp.]